MSDPDVIMSTKQLAIMCVSVVAVVWILCNGMVGCSNEIKTGNQRYTEGYLAGYKEGIEVKR